MEALKVKRRENFSAAECQLLIEEVELAQSVLFNKFSRTLDWTKKTKKWSQITEKINACGGDSLRSVPQVKKKWQDLKKTAKAKECAKRRHMKGTGGGPPPRDLSSMEEKIISIIPDLLIEGIPGGLDTEPMSLEEEVVEAEIDEAVTQLPQASSVESFSELHVATNNLQSVTRKETTQGKHGVRVRGEDEVIVLQREQLLIQKERLGIERERLGIERERLAIEREKVVALNNLSGTLVDLLGVRRDINIDSECNVLEPVIQL